MEDVSKKKRKHDILVIGIALFIALAILGIALLFSNKDKTNDDKNDEIVLGDKYKSYKYGLNIDGKYQVINNKYFVADSPNEFKIMDLKTNVLYEGDKTLHNSAFEGLDGKIYIFSIKETDKETEYFISSLKNGKVNHINNFILSNKKYMPFIFTKDNKEYLEGFVEYEHKDDKDIYNFYDLDFHKHELGTNIPLGNQGIFTGEDVYKQDYKNCILFANNDSNVTKYGLYSTSYEKNVIEPIYTNLISNKHGNFIAEKDGKAGIVNYLNEVLVEFEYDFIAPFRDGYVVSNNDKMAVMNKDYKMITDYQIDFRRKLENSRDSHYYYIEEGGVSNDFALYKVGSKYILKEWDNPNSKNPGMDYYIIYESGNLKKGSEPIFEVADDLIYSYDFKNIKLYNDELKVYLTIPWSKDIDDIRMLDPSTLLINDSYYNIKENKRLESLVESKDGDFLLKRDLDNFITTIKYGDEVLAKIEGSPKFRLKDTYKGYYAMNSFNYVYIEKNEKYKDQ